MVRQWSITICVAVATAAVLLTAGVLLVPANDGRDAQAATEEVAAATQAARERAAAGIPSASQSSASTQQQGPEGVPVPAAKPLGPVTPATKDKARSGVPCGSGEQLGYHVHAYIRIFVRGKPRQVPMGIGIGKPWRTTHSREGAFVSGGSCFSWLHTHSADGIVHIEAPARTSFNLGQLFDVWGQRLDRTHLGPYHTRVTAWLNGKRYLGNPRRIPLAKHGQIQLSVGSPRVKQKPIGFPQGL